MYKLNASAFDVGLDSETCLLLSSLQNIASLYPVLPSDPPVTIAVIRAQLETGQVSTFDDAAFDQFLNRLYSLDLDKSALNANEISVLNTIFEYLDPPANLSCCGGVLFPSLPTDASLLVSERVGSNDLEYSVDVALNDLFSCDIFDIELTLIVPVGAPNPVSNPVTLDKLGCVESKQTFKKLWLEFAVTPATFSYAFICNFRDSTGTSLSVINIPYTF